MTRTESMQAGEVRLLSEAEVRAAVSSANVPTLLMMIFQMTGDERWLNDPYLPTRGKGLGDHDDGGLPKAIQTEIRSTAVQVILDLQNGVAPAIEIPSEDLITRMLSVCMGEPVPSEYGAMFREELAKRINPAAAPEPPRVRAPEGFSVVVVGAALAGIAAIHELEDMGLDYVVLERNSAPGGNWWENVYPGCGVDTPSHLYSYSFAKKDWRQHFELRDAIQAYFDDVISRLGADDRIRYGVEVVRAEYDADAQRWRITTRDHEGRTETLVANVLISAVGVLNNPRIPDVSGVGEFDGPEFHSSRWPTDLDLTGKRVAVVGNGASAMQIVPAIAGEVASLTIFQRSTHWVAPFEKFGVPISPELRTLIASCPIYFAWYWARLFWQFGDKVIEALRVDPEWTHHERSVNARNDAHRAYFTRYIKSELQGHPELISRVVPSYPPFGKRILLDNGWYETLTRDNVELVSEAVAGVGPHSVTTASGARYGDFDVLVWATGFYAARFLASLDLIGLDGVSIRDEWDDDNPRAYLGVAVPGFPNFFMLGGPNTFPGSGSFTFFNEIQMQYIRQLITKMLTDGIGQIEITRAAYDEYNERVDEVHARTVWTHPGMETFFRNNRGRVVFLNPFLNLEFWQMTRAVDPELFVTRPAADDRPAQGANGARVHR